jgi:hypothetical protein
VRRLPALVLAALVCAGCCAPFFDGVVCVRTSGLLAVSLPPDPADPR